MFYCHLRYSFSMKSLRNLLIPVSVAISVLAPTQAFGSTPNPLDKGKVEFATQKMISSFYPKQIVAGVHTVCAKYQKSLVKLGYSFTCVTYSKSGKQTVMTTVKITGIYKSEWNFSYSISPLAK